MSFSFRPHAPSKVRGRVLVRKQVPGPCIEPQKLDQWSCYFCARSIISNFHMRDCPMSSMYHPEEHAL